jgi:hypothetical protein
MREKERGAVCELDIRNGGRDGENRMARKTTE